MDIYKHISKTLHLLTLRGCSRGGREKHRGDFRDFWENDVLFSHALSIVILVVQSVSNLIPHLMTEVIDRNVWIGTETKEARIMP